MGSDTGLKHQHKLMTQIIFQMQQWDKNTSREATSKEEELATSALMEVSTITSPVLLSLTFDSCNCSADTTHEDMQNCWIYFVCK